MEKFTGSLNCNTPDEFTLSVSRGAFQVSKYYKRLEGITRDVICIKEVFLL